MDRANLEDGMTVLIAGAGPIGLGVVAAIRQYFKSVKIVCAKKLQSYVRRSPLTF